MKAATLWTIVALGTGTCLWAFDAHPDICSLVNAPMFCTCDLFSPNQAHTVSCFIFATVTSNHTLWNGFSQQHRIRFLTLTSGVNSTLTFIPTGVLRMTTRLESVAIHEGHLDTLWPYSFVNMTHLQNISLERNDIYTIELFAFSFLPNLTKLILSENEIRRLPAEAFYRLPKMKILYIDRNNLSIIDDMAFADLPALEVLEMNDNSIEQLTSKTFHGLGHLKRLDICRNKLTRLVDQVFVGAPLLNDLDLHDNLIEDISARAFKGLAHLNSLKLNSNRIKHLVDIVFKGSPNLMAVDLTRNRLQTFRKEILDPLTYSKKEQFIVFLKENQLQCNCDILWLIEYSEKSPSHLFRREVRHLKCRRHNGNVRISKLSAEELECPLAAIVPERMDNRPKQKSPKRSDSPHQRDMAMTSSTQSWNDEETKTESRNMEESSILQQENELHFKEQITLQPTDDVQLIYNHQNISRPFGAQVRHNSSRSKSVARLAFLLSIVCGHLSFLVL